MILQALTDYYRVLEQAGKIDAPGWAPVKVSYALLLSESGTLEQVIDNLKAELRARHTKRLQAGECTIETGMLFFDIINSFERIADHCSNLAVCIIELSQGSYQTHRYLKSVKSQENARFMKSFEDYLRKYALH